LFRTHCTASIYLQTSDRDQLLLYWSACRNEVPSTFFTAFNGKSEIIFVVHCRTRKIMNGKSNNNIVIAYYLRESHQWSSVDNLILRYASMYKTWNIFTFSNDNSSSHYILCILIYWSFLTYLCFVHLQTAVFTLLHPDKQKENIIPRIFKHHISLSVTSSSYAVNNSLVVCIGI